MKRRKKLDTPLAASSQFSTPTHFTYLIPSTVSPPLSGKKPPPPSSVLPAVTAKESLGMLLLRQRLRHPTVVGNAKYNAGAAYTHARRSPPRPRCARPRRRRRSRQRRRRERSSARGADGGVAGDVWRATTRRSRAAAGRQRGNTGGDRGERIAEQRARSRRVTMREHISSHGSAARMRL
ncbi:uncharacterized protein LOC119318569 isoform X2 [Triticum dicoccoides]|uniref:uncharacterized protein LOC119318569 isoform X2 n=1 Tax=Triticum dicoccoides TaxID=85692 RepID=UPI001891828A|nr:uncharacterized protein LOC119318569 isoform X2 [Triticum dicoccoides]